MIRVLISLLPRAAFELVGTALGPSQRKAESQLASDSNLRWRVRRLPLGLVHGRSCFVYLAFEVF